MVLEKKKTVLQTGDQKSSPVIAFNLCDLKIKNKSQQLNKLKKSENLFFCVYCERGRKRQRFEI